MTGIGMDKYPAVFVIILNWNGLQDTLECLGSLVSCDYPNFNVIVVDNGSTDGSSDTIRERYPEVHLIRNDRNLGFAAGNNEGIRRALDHGAEMVWLLNNDTVVEKSTLSQLVTAAMESQMIGLASPIIRYYDEPEAIQFCGSYIDWENKRIVKMSDPVKDNDLNMPICLWGTALFIKRDLIEKIGYLNEKYFAYHEDEDYSMRAVMAGFRNIVEHRAIIYHKNSRSTGSNDAPLQVFLRSRNLYFLWMDALKGMERVFHLRRYLAHIISYGGSLREKNLPDSVEACLDGVWNAVRGVGGPRNPEVSMPIPLRGLFRFLFSWHPFLWTSLLTGDLAGIGENMRKRLRARKEII